MVQPERPSNQQTSAFLLADAVRVFTAAARLGQPGSGAVGDERGEPVGWAEFVTLALAGAAANIGHVEAVLAGRPGLWEAEAVRQLLISTVGDDDRQLLRQRTEPVVIDLYVDEILLDAGAWTTYDQANEELHRREVVLCVDTSRPLTAEQERECDVIGDKDDRLEVQRRAGWAGYGEALRAHIEVAAALLSELTVPVVVRVDVHTFRPYGEREGSWGFVTLGAGVICAQRSRDDRRGTVEVEVTTWMSGRRDPPALPMEAHHDQPPSKRTRGQPARPQGTHPGCQTGSESSADAGHPVRPARPRSTDGA